MPIYKRNLTSKAQCPVYFNSLHFSLMNVLVDHLTIINYLVQEMNSTHSFPWQQTFLDIPDFS